MVKHPLSHPSIHPSSSPIPNYPLIIAFLFHVFLLIIFYFSHKFIYSDITFIYIQSFIHSLAYLLIYYSELIHPFPLPGEKREIQDFCIKDLLPETTEYITYEGSMTVPGCEETVTWLIYNKPMCISQNDVWFINA